MSLAPIPKPSSVGQGIMATIKTQSSYVNVRTGPDTNYADIGDIINNSTVTYYPASERDGWLWVEQSNLSGWVYKGVVSFQDAPTTTPNTTPSPYDGGIGMWHWKGSAIPENTIVEYIESMQRLAPNVKQIWVKVGDGNSWQGRFDSSQMAVNGPADVDRWVQTLERYGLEFHAWTVLKGVDIAGEASIMIETCKRPGVKSLIMDVEPYEHYWRAGREPIAPLMTNVRSNIPDGFHIGLGIDPRRAHYNSIYPDAWHPYVDSVHTMSYWKTFQRSVESVIDETYAVWGNYGKPLIPILQGNATLQEQQEAFSLITNRYNAKAVSWWRYGVINQWLAVNTPIVVNSGGNGDNGAGGSPDDDDGTIPSGTEQIIRPDSSDFRSGTYTGNNEFQTFSGAMGWDVKYTTTEQRTSKVWAEWKTELLVSGNYQIAVFVPSRHATTRKARYKIHGIRGTNTEVIVDLNQSIYNDEWVSLGIFDLVKGQPNAGKVFLNDVTGESGREIAFDAIRLKHVVEIDNGTTNPPDNNQPDPPEIVNGVYVADGYDSPVGTETERNGSQLWPSGWRDASPYARLYFVGTPREAYHTGADLNYGSPYADRGMPVYSPASGVVVYQANLSVWGNVTVIRHDPLRSPTGKVMWTRYGHMQNLRVNVGDRVKRGQQIGEIGDAGGRYVPHLHYDICPTDKVERSPGDWPGKSLSRIYQDYVDPLDFTRDNRP